MTLQVARVSDWPVERITAMMPSVVAHAERIVAESPDQLTVAYLLEGLAPGRDHHLWIAYDEDDPATAVLAMFVELRHYHATQVTFARVSGIAGSRIHEALPMLDQIEAWAAAQGAIKIVAVGRRGWEPLLRARGYALEAVMLSKEIDHV